MERKKASDYPQEVFDLFHDTSTATSSRRDFIDRVGKYAVGGVTGRRDLREPQAELRVGAAGAERRRSG